MALPQPLARAVRRVAASERFAAIAPRIVPPIDRALNRISGGRLFLGSAMVPLAMLTTTGARSGKVRRSPVAAVPWKGEHYVVGSNFGSRRHPGWTYNLLAEPEATLTIRGRESPVQAELLSEEDKTAVWPGLTEAWPLFDLYVERSGRDLRVFRLVER